MKERLSVIIPGYNTSQHDWERCLRSVIAATGDDDEIICIDDGSKQPPLFLTDFERTCPRVKVLFEKTNRGQSAVRNKALELARGDFVAFVDSDDEIAPGIYSKARETALRTNSDIVAFGIETIWICARLCRDAVFEDRSIGVLTTSDLSDFVSRQLFDEPVNKIYRREFLDANGIRFPVDVCPGEDTMFNLACVMHDARWATVSDVGYFYYRVDGTTLSRYQAHMPETLRYWNDRWNEYLMTKGRGYEGRYPTRGYSKSFVARAQWLNIWRFGSPYSLRDKWRYLVTNRNAIGGFLVLRFLRQFLFTFARRHFYIRLIRRWNVKRLYYGVREWR